eukprot:SAG11_NODE_13392_length_657_cov_1.413978_2_plen_96_part_01
MRRRKPNDVWGPFEQCVTLLAQMKDGTLHVISDERRARLETLRRRLMMRACTIGTVSGLVIAAFVRSPAHDGTVPQKPLGSTRSLLRSHDVCRCPC